MTSADYYRSALAPLRAALSEDGYDVEVDKAADRLVVAVRARSDACPECLVPKRVFETLVRKRFAEAEVELSACTLTIQYPGDETHNAPARDGR